MLAQSALGRLRQHPTPTGEVSTLSYANQLNQGLKGGKPIGNEPAHMPCLSQLLLYHKASAEMAHKPTAPLRSHAYVVSMLWLQAPCSPTPQQGPRAATNHFTPLAFLQALCQFLRKLSTPWL